MCIMIFLFYLKFIYFSNFTPALDHELLELALHPLTELAPETRIHKRKHTGGRAHTQTRNYIFDATKSIYDRNVGHRIN